VATHRPSVNGMAAASSCTAPTSIALHKSSMMFFVLTLEGALL
jgi:hypothetical protein